MAIGLFSPTAGLAADAGGQAALLRRVDALEARVERLEARAPAPASASATSSDAKWKSAEAWKRLKKSMSEAEVVEILGKPTTGIRSQGTTQMTYAEGNLIGVVHFSQAGNLEFWAEPYF